MIITFIIIVTVIMIKAGLGPRAAAERRQRRRPGGPQQ